MLQRIQSVLLVLVAIAMVTILRFPLWEKADAKTNEKVTLTSFELVHETTNAETDKTEIITKHTFYIAIAAIAAAIIALYSISRYKRRLLQMKLGALNSLVMGGGVLGLSIYYTYQAEADILPYIQGKYSFAFYLCIAAMFFNIIANRFIRKDECLVRSADRIR